MWRHLYVVVGELFTGPRLGDPTMADPHIHLRISVWWIRDRYEQLLSTVSHPRQGKCRATLRHTRGTLPFTTRFNHGTSALAVQQFHLYSSVNTGRARGQRSPWAVLLALCRYCLPTGYFGLC